MKGWYAPIVELVEYMSPTNNHSSNYTYVIILEHAKKKLDCLIGGITPSLMIHIHSNIDFNKKPKCPFQIQMPQNL